MVLDKCGLSAYSLLVVVGLNFLSVHEIEAFTEWCDRGEYEYKLVPLHSWAGMRTDVPKTEVEGLIDPHRSQRLGPCSSLWNGFTIAWDGRVPVCFQDADIQECLGTVPSQSIEVIWTSTHLAKRRQHLNQQFNGLCSQCDSNTEVVLPGNGSSLYPVSYLK